MSALGAMIAAVLIAGCGSPSNGNGLVIGGIDYCAAINVGGQPRFVAGTVVVFRGTRVDPPPSAGQVATATVRAEEQYRFELPPGPYVLVAHDAEGGAMQRLTTVTVKAGETIGADIPNACI